MGIKGPKWLKQLCCCFPERLDYKGISDLNPHVDPLAPLDAQPTVVNAATPATEKTDNAQTHEINDCQDERSLTPVPSEPESLPTSGAAGAVEALWDAYGEEFVQRLSSILDIVGEVAEGLPFGKAAMGLIGVAVGALKNHWDNVQSMREIFSLLSQIAEYLGPFDNTATARERLHLTMFKTELQSCIDQLIKFKGTKRWSQIYKAKEFTDLLDKLRRDLDNSVKLVTMAAIFNVEASLKRGFDEIKLDGQQSKRISERLTLEQLSPVKEAQWTVATSVSPCLPDTRVDVIKRIVDWAEDGAGPSFLWLTGQMGSGKSAIIKSVCGILREKEILGAAYFAQRYESTPSSPTDPAHLSRVIPSLVYSLASSNEVVRKSMMSILVGDPNLPFADLETQVEQLLRPSLLLMNLTTVRVVVIDGLNNLPQHDRIAGGNMIQLLSDQCSSRTKFLLCGLGTNGVNWAIQSLPKSKCHVIDLHDIGENVVAQDIRRVYDNHFRSPKLHPRPTNRAAWPPEGELKRLVEYTGRSFSFATLAKQYVTHIRHRPEPRLTKLIRAIEEGTDDQLDQLYRLILDDAVTDVSTQGRVVDGVVHARVRLVLVGLVLAQELIDGPTLAALVGLEAAEIESDLIQLSPALSYTRIGESWVNIRVFHSSFQQYMLSRCHDRRLLVLPASDHASIAGHCFDLIEQSLGPTTGRTPVSSPLLYACVHVWSHLRLSYQATHGRLSPDLVAKLHKFCEDLRFRWLDVLGDLGIMTEGMKQLEIAVASMHEASHQSHNAPPNLLLAQCIIRLGDQDFHQHAIAPSSRRVYSSARGLSVAVETAYPVPVPKVTSLHLKIIASHSRLAHRGSVLALTGSRNNLGLVASGGADGDIFVWHGDPCLTATTVSPISHDEPQTSNLAPSYQSLTHKYGLAFTSNGHGLISAVNGTLRRSDFDGRSEIVNTSEHLFTSIVTALNGDHIVYVSGDKVHLWSITTQRCLWSLDPSSPPPAQVLSLAISVDDKYIATGSTDETVAVMSLSNGKVVHRFGEHEDAVLAVAFSPHHPSKLASASRDGTIRLWDVDQHVEMHTFFGHAKDVISLGWATQRYELYSGSIDDTMRVWDTGTGKQLFVISHFPSPLSSLAILPLGDQVVIGCKNGSLHTWQWSDATPTQDITLIAASPTHSAFVTYARSGFVHVIDATTGTVVQIIASIGADTTPTSITFSEDGLRILFVISNKHMSISLDLQTLQALPPLENSSLHQVQFSLEDDGWLRFAHSTSEVFRDKETPLCWFPPPRRWKLGSRPLAVNGTVVAVGGVDGRLTLLDFSTLDYLLE